MKAHQIPTLIYGLNVKKPGKLLRVLLDYFCGDQSKISFEGDLSYFDTEGIEVISQEPKDILSRTGTNKNGIVVLLLNSASKDGIVRNILPRAGIHNRIWHILIMISNKLLAT